MQTINKKSVIKIFYYLMAIDGNVSEDELSKLDEIGTDIIGTEYAAQKEEIIEECSRIIDSVEVDDETYDVLQEAVDSSLAIKAQRRADGVWPRHLLWNMLVIANADGDFSEVENRLISHVARVLDVEKSVVVEMKQMIMSANSVQAELEQLNASNKPYNEIRPIVDETEKRKQALFEAVTALIEDEIIFAKPEYTEKKNSFVENGKKITESVVPKAKEFGKITQKSVKSASDFLGDKASHGAEELKSGTGKLLSKMKDITKK